MRARSETHTKGFAGVVGVGSIAIFWRSCARGTGDAHGFLKASSYLATELCNADLKLLQWPIDCEMQCDTLIACVHALCHLSSLWHVSSSQVLQLPG